MSTYEMEGQKVIRKDTQEQRTEINVPALKADLAEINEKIAKLQEKKLAIKAEIDIIKAQLNVE